MGTMVIAPLMCHLFSVQPGLNGMIANVASAVKSETIGAMMYGSSIALDGANVSLRMSLIRSTIDCSSPNDPARFEP